MGLKPELEAWKKSRRTKKVLYHFAVFAIVIELLIVKNCRISPAWLMQVCDEMWPLSHRVVRRARSCLLQTAIATHERCVTLDPHSARIVSPSFYHKIKFSNGIEKYFVCMYVSVQAYMPVIEKYQFYCLQHIQLLNYSIRLLNLFFFF